MDVISSPPQEHIHSSSFHVTRVRRYPNDTKVTHDQRVKVRYLTESDSIVGFYPFLFQHSTRGLPRGQATRELPRALRGASVKQLNLPIVVFASRERSAADVRSTARLRRRRKATSLDAVALRPRVQVVVARAVRKTREVA